MRRCPNCKAEYEWRANARFKFHLVHNEPGCPFGFDVAAHTKLELWTHVNAQERRVKACGRTACQAACAPWWNRVTEKFYCTPCARRINESSVESGLGELCTLTKPEENL